MPIKTHAHGEEKIYRPSLSLSLPLFQGKLFASRNKWPSGDRVFNGAGKNWPGYKPTRAHAGTIRGNRRVRALVSLFAAGVFSATGVLRRTAVLFAIALYDFLRWILNAEFLAGIAIRKLDFDLDRKRMI